MKLFPFFLIVGISASAQVEIYFKYDEAGNQIYRGNSVLGREAKPDPLVNPNEKIDTNQETPKSSTSLAMTEEEFWSEIQIYPVPVKDRLTIKWSDKVNELIGEIGLYQQSTVHWVFQNSNIETLNHMIEMDMSSHYMGVYVLTFVLKDGRRLSKNITKI